MDEEELKEIRTIIASTDWLEYHEKLPNEEVIKLAKQAHIGLLPTMGDTFGFSVLEMQACGCPVITTDRQALPEINNDQCGWLINTKDIPLSHGDDFAHYTRDEVDDLSKTIREQLIKIGAVALDNRISLQERAENSLERIKMQHAPIEYRSKLCSIYEQAMRGTGLC